MKKYIIFFVISIVLYSCTPQKSTTFVIDGTIEGICDSTIISVSYITLNSGQWENVRHQTHIIDGRFHLEGNINELTAGNLFFDKYEIPIYLEPVKIKLIIKKDSLYDCTLIGTSVENENRELLNIFAAEQKKYDDIKDSIVQIFENIKLNESNSNLVDSLMQRAYYWKSNLMAHISILDSIRFNFVAKHMSYRITPYLIYELARNEANSMDIVMELYNKLPKSSKESVLGKLALEQINETSMIVSRKDLQVGDMAPDFSRKNTQGKVVRLSDFRNKKYVLLDFWASWCGPCLKQMPQIKKLQAAFKNRELCVIGVSADVNRKDWIDAINQNQLGAWEQILERNDPNDYCFIKSGDIMNIYDVRAIPQCFLIDKQGKILLKCNHIGDEEFAYIDKILP